MGYSTIYQGNGGAIDIWTGITQNVSDNYSTLTVIAYVKKTNASYYSYRNSPQTFTLRVNNFPVTYGWTFNFSNMTLGTRYEITRSVRTIYHNADGSHPAVPISVYCETGTDGLGTISGSTSITPDPIPRTSTPTLSVYTQFLDSTITVNTNRASSSFTHTITYSFQGLSGTIGTGVTTSKDWILPSSFANKMQSITQEVGTITVTTYNGSTVVGSKSINFTAVVPDNSNYNPSVSVPTLSVEGIGLDSTSGLFIQNYTRVIGAFTATVQYGAFIKSSSMTLQKTDGTNSQTVAGNNVTFARVGSHGRYRLIARLEDSRGRVSTATREFNVAEYSPPVISKFSGYRVNNSATVESITIGSYSLLDAYNLCHVTLSKRQVGNTSWTTIIADAPQGYGDIYLPNTNAGNDDYRSYEFRVVATDSLGRSATETFTIGTARVPFSIGRDIGIGVGKVWESGALDVQGTSNFNGDTYLTGSASLNGYSLLTLASQINADYVGGFTAAQLNTIYGSNSNGHYIKFPNGTLICWQEITFSTTVTSAWGSLFYHSPRTWTFPVAFVGNRPACNASCTDAGAELIGTVPSSTLTSAKYYGLRPTSITASTSVTFRLTAIGRWK